VASLSEFDPDTRATWQRLNVAVDQWFVDNRSRLEEEYPWEPGVSTLVSFELGVYLTDSDEGTLQYDQTPKPGWTFANTGVDGEHFTALTSPERLGVVVLTAPMAFDSPNLVVGQTLEEFLAIAFTVGVTGLTELCYRGGLNGPHGLEPRPTELHGHLRSALQLSPPADVAARLRELQDEVPLARGTH